MKTIRVNIDDILKASTIITKAQIGNLLVEVCKFASNISGDEINANKEEKFLLNSLLKSLATSKHVAKRASEGSKARWSKEKGENNV